MILLLTAMEMLAYTTALYIIGRIVLPEIGLHAPGFGIILVAVALWMALGFIKGLIHGAVE